MYEPEEDYMEEGDESEEISNEIWQEACWTVISAYFEEKGKTVLNENTENTLLISPSFRSGAAAAGLV